MGTVPKVYIATNPDDPRDQFALAAFCKVGHRVPKGKALDGMPTCGTMGCLCAFDADPDDLRLATPVETATFWSEIAEYAHQAVPV